MKRDEHGRKESRRVQDDRRRKEVACPEAITTTTTTTTPTVLDRAKEKKERKGEREREEEKERRGRCIRKKRRRMERMIESRSCSMVYTCRRLGRFLPVFFTPFIITRKRRCALRPIRYIQ